MIFQGKYLDSALSIAIISILKIAFFSPLSTTAQVIPDNTLGTESSLVTPVNSSSPISPISPTSPNPNIQQLQQYLIEGGAIRDSNLFHSFREFNVNNGQQVNFSNPENIANILTRVTGSNASNIFGALGVNGDANLFLINPNGIILGENASININGSFFASTAENINFADGNSFSAVNTAAPPLLTISIPVGLQLGNNPASIQAQHTTINAGNVTLIGGDINLEKTTIKAPSGQVQLGSLANNGTINFNNSFPVDIIRGNINISDRSLIDVIGNGGGDIIIDAGNFTMNASDFQVGISENRGQINSVVGDVYLNATGNILLENNSNINSNLRTNSLGLGGTITIEAQNLTLNNSRIFSSTQSTGQAGDIDIKLANKLEIVSNSSNSEGRQGRKGLFSIVAPQGRGNGGNIFIEAPEISLSGLGGIDSSTVSIGHGGTITIISDRVTIDDGAGIFANSRGIGNGGEIVIQATESIIVSDKQTPNQTSDGRPLPGGIIADVRFDARGNGGNINLETARLDVSNGAMISTDTKGSGNGGNITIQATELVAVTGRNSSNRSSQIVAAVRPNVSGNSGNIAIETKDLSIRDGAEINAETESTGDAGNLSILATGTVELRGTSTNGIPSNLIAQVGRNASGKGGDIFLAAQNLIIADGGQISASTLGTGKGGTVKVGVVEEIYITGSSPIPEQNVRGANSFIKNASRTVFPSGIFASSPGKGNADALTIETGNITLHNGAQISVSSQRQGAAGNLTINAETINLNNSILSAETVEGEQANILLTAPDIQLRNNSLVTTNARNTATGGNIDIDTETLVAFKNSDITANAEDSFGGKVTISAQGVFGIQVRERPSAQSSDITATSKLGTEFNGVVQINTPDADTVSGIIQLPTNFIDASKQIVASCALDRNNSFVVTGRGGLPTNPQEFLRSQTVLQDWRISVNSEQLSMENDRLLDKIRRSKIIEAQQWIVNNKGVVELIANSSPSNSDLWLRAMPCS